MRKAFLLYLDSLEVFNELSDTQIANIMRAIIQHEKGKDYKLTQVERIAFLPIKNYLQFNSSKWSNEIEKRREAGRLGGLAKARNRKGKGDVKQVLASARSAKHSLANLADNVTVTVTDIHREGEIPTPKSTKSSKEDITSKEFLEYLSVTDPYKNYQITSKYLSLLAEKIASWAEAKGKVVKNWKATARNWLLSDIQEDKLSKSKKLQNDEFMDSIII